MKILIYIWCFVTLVLARHQSALELKPELRFSQDVAKYRDVYDPFYSDTDFTYQSDEALYDPELVAYEDQLEEELFSGPDPTLTPQEMAYIDYEEQRIGQYQAGFGSWLKKVGSSIKKGFQKAGQSLKKWGESVGPKIASWGKETFVKPFAKAGQILAKWGTDVAAKATVFGKTLVQGGKNFVEGWKKGGLK
ncbi:hypothetical protein HDU91_001988, partial [Kappamyces sp. JEL0680]